MEIVKSKYNNIKTEYNGVKYDSKKESLYAQKLDMLTKAVGRERVIKYERQVPFQIEIAGKKICKYLLDFKYCIAIELNTWTLKECVHQFIDSRKNLLRHNLI